MATVMVLGTLAACQPRAISAEQDCPLDPPAAGTVRVAPVACSEQIPTAGEGTVADIVLANSQFVAIVRTGQDALTLRGVGGGTVVDATRWGLNDALHEMVPIVGGGWLDVHDVSPGADRVTVTGEVRALFAHRPADEGAQRQISYVVTPESPWLQIEGADGLYLHPRGDHDTWGDGLFTNGPVAYAPDGGTVEDLGGAVLIDGASALMIATSATAQATRATPPGKPATGVRIAGTAVGANRLALHTDGRRIGTVPLSDETFDTVVPAHVDAIQAEAGGWAASSRVPPGENMMLEVGAPGSITLIPAAGNPPTLLDWATQDGRSGSLFLGSGERLLALGAGVHRLDLSAGPAYRSQQLRVEVHPDQQLNLGVQLTPRFDVGRWVLVAFDQPADRSRTFLGSNTTAAHTALGAGVGYAVFSSEDDVAGVRRTRTGRLPPNLAFRSGVTVREPGNPGFTVTAWPWQNTPRDALHGGLQATSLSALDTAAALTGGPDDDRTLRVDLGWLAQAGAPHLADPQPDFVALGPPGPDLQTWRPWLDWLDAGRALIPTGPHTWVQVTDPTQFAEVDVEQPLFRGNVATGTGAVLQLTVDGRPPGEVVAAGPSADTSDTAPPFLEVVRPTRRTVRLSAMNTEGLTHVAIVVTGGRVLQRWRLDTLGDTPSVTRTGPLPAGWVMAVATSEDDPSRWAATGPVWVR